jgi:hypothetical protein
MKLKKMSCTLAVSVALCLVQNASAWPDFAWTGLGGDGMWNNPANWNNLDETTNTTGLPDTGTGAVQIDQANGSTQATIPAGYVADLGFATPGAPLYNTVFGPEFGMTLNIYGTLQYNWMMAPVQNDPTPGNRTHINLYSGSTLQTQGAGLGIGDAWWWYQAAPYVTVNMYGNAQMNVPNVGLGGHLNIYDTATANISVNVFTGNPLVGGTGNGSSVACSDGTASLLLGGGTLMLPTGYTNEATQAGNTIYDLVARGVLRAYGKGEDTNDLIVTDNGTNTTVTTVPLGGALQRVYFHPLLRPNVTVGTFQQSILVGDYPSVSGVLLSSSEPGLNPASFTHPVYASSNPNVATVNTNGLVTAVGAGSAILTASVGALNSTNSVTITVGPIVPNLVHDYKFNETSGTTAADSVGGATGTLNGDATFSGTGSLVLSGNVGSSVTLPAGILSGLDEVTIEAWATFPGTINTWANLFAFGNTDLIAFDPNNGAGENYLVCGAHTGGLTTSLNFGQGVPGSAGERDAAAAGVLDNQTNVHVVAVFHPLAGYESLYINGTLAATTTILNTLIDPVAAQGATFTNKSILAYTLGADPLNYIGQSLYLADPGLLANIDEFRIYSTPLTAAQVKADYALGPNQVIGTSTNVSLKGSVTGGNLLIKWPTTSALVTVMASPTLGSGAVWIPVNGTLTTDGSGNYQMTVPNSGTTQFFRLQE